MQNTALACLHLKVITLWTVLLVFVSKFSRSAELLIFSIPLCFFPLILPLLETGLLKKVLIVHPEWRLRSVENFRILNQTNESYLKIGYLTIFDQPSFSNVQISNKNAVATIYAMTVGRQEKGNYFLFIFLSLCKTQWQNTLRKTGKSSVSAGVL